MEKANNFSLFLDSFSSILDWRNYSQRYYYLQLFNNLYKRTILKPHTYKSLNKYLVDIQKAIDKCQQYI